MYDLTTTNTSVSYTNKALRKATETIYSIADSVRKSAFQTAAIIAEIDDLKAYEQDGFKTVHEWTETAFGIKKSQSYDLLTVGREYTAILRDSKDRVCGYRSSLTAPDAKVDFNVTQVAMLAHAEKAVVDDLLKAGKIVPTMTCAEIKRVLHDARLVEDKTDDTEDTDETEEAGEDKSKNGEDKSKADNKYRVRDSWGGIYDVPLSVLKKYRVQPVEVKPIEVKPDAVPVDRKAETKEPKPESKSPKSPKSPKNARKTKAKRNLEMEDDRRAEAQAEAAVFGTQD